MYHLIIAGGLPAITSDDFDPVAVTALGYEKNLVKVSGRRAPQLYQVTDFHVSPPDGQPYKVLSARQWSAALRDSPRSEKCHF